MSMAVSDSQTYLDQNKGSKSGCCGTRSGLERKLIALTSCLAVLSIALVIALAVVAATKKTEGSASAQLEASTMAPPPTCHEEHCQKAGLYLSMNMNMSADPCDDFHEFVCGNWTKNKPIPEDKGRYGVFDDLRDDLAKTCIGVLQLPVTSTSPVSAVDKARYFFQSCLKTENVTSAEGVEQLRSLLKDVGINADIVANGSHVPSDFKWIKTLSKIVRMYGSNFILSFGVGADIKDTTRNMISLDQPGSFGLGRSFLLESVQEKLKAYKNYINASLCLLHPKNCLDMPQVADDIIKFEVDMAKLTRSPVERRNASTWYFPMKISELQTNIQDIPFLEYMKEILNGSYQGLTEDTVVIMKEELYFGNITTLINSTKPGVVSNYLGWRLIQTLGPSLFKDFRDIKFEFDKVNLGIKKEKDNDDRCFDLTNSYLGQAVGSLYVEKINFNEKAKMDVEKMVGYLAEAFRALVDQNDWMDPLTKTASKTKLDKIVAMIGYPDWTRIPDELNEYYEKLEALNKDNFLEIYKTSMKFSTLKSLEKLGKSNNRTADWISAASIVNAFYSPSYNSITFPAGILQIPFYGERLKVLNYGAIGYVIGHEITHGFDDSGRQYDGDGSLENWWTPETLTKFTERKNCFIKQYSSIKDDISDLNLNGEQTIGENIADNGGIRESYQAYLLSGRETSRLPGLEKFDDNQLFFISAGSIWCSQFRKEEMINQINQGVHSPGMYRAYIPLANTIEFAEAFNCRLKSKMNPINRCEIW